MPDRRARSRRAAGRVRRFAVAARRAATGLCHQPYRANAATPLRGLSQQRRRQPRRRHPGSLSGRRAPGRRRVLRWPRAGLHRARTAANRRSCSSMAAGSLTFLETFEPVADLRISPTSPVSNGCRRSPTTPPMPNRWPPRPSRRASRSDRRHSVQAASGRGTAVVALPVYSIWRTNAHDEEVQRIGPQHGPEDVLVVRPEFAGRSRAIAGGGLRIRHGARTWRQPVGGG